MTRPRLPHHYALCPDVLWWPTLFDGAEGLDRGAAAECVAIVRDLVEHAGFALSDTGQGPLAAVQQAVRAWPAVPRRQVQELFAQLHRERRWVAGPPAAAPPDVHGCDWAATAAGQSDGVVVPVTCHCARGDHREFGDPNAAAATDYWAAPWRQAMQDGGVSVDGEWTREAFARVFWRPLLRHATTVTVVDRYIGRSHADNGQTASQRRYREALRYVVAVWKSTTPPDGRRTLILVTGDGGFAPGPVYARLAGLKAELEREDWLSVDVDLRHEAPGALPHERWLYTGQGLWQLGGGLDLFRNNGQLAAHVYSRLPRSMWHHVAQQQYQKLGRFRPTPSVRGPGAGDTVAASSVPDRLAGLST